MNQASVLGNQLSLMPYQLRKTIQERALLCLVGTTSVLLTACTGDDLPPGPEASTTAEPTTTTTTTTPTPETGSTTATDPSTSTTDEPASSSSSTSSGPDPDSGSGSSSSEGSSGSGSSTGEAVGDPVMVEWTEFMVINDCFLFNDPSVLGPDAVWVDAAGMIGLTFDTVPGTTFEGTVNGTDLVLVGVTTADFAGEIWQYTETFTGMLVDGHYVGQWSYSECNTTVAPETCPNDGFCGGTANFDVTLP